MAILTRSQNWVHPQTFDDIEQANEWARLHYIEHQNESSARKLDFLPRVYLVEKYMIVPSGSFTRGAAAPDVGYEGTFSTLLFANTGTETAYYNLHVPGDRADGTDLKLSIYWAPTDGNAGGVAWEFDWEAVATEANETLGAGSTHVDIHDVTQSLDNELLETAYGTIAGASISADDTIGIHLYRDHDDGDDTYGADAALIHMEVEYYSDTLGVDA
jgi:hypothetical protein